MNLSRLEYNEIHPDSGIKLLPQAFLAWNRVHECKGTSKIIFALWLAQKAKGTILWINETHNQETLNPDGIYPYVNPAQFLLPIYVVKKIFYGVQKKQCAMRLAL